MISAAVAGMGTPVADRDGRSRPLRDAAFLPGRLLDTRINRALALGIGVLLPVLTLRTQYFGTPTDLLARIVPVDFVCVALLAVLFLRHRMQAVPMPALLYAGAVVLALVPGLIVTPGPEREVWVQLLALLMAFGFYLAGLNLGAFRPLLRWLLTGMCLAVLAEAVVVFHDAFTPTQWFPDPMAGRVRGTFRANGQLGAYGFCAGGFLVTFGATLAAPRFRKVCVAAAVLCASFIFLASRRTGMVSVFAWGALFAVLGARFAKRRFYALFVSAFLAVLILVAALWPQVERSFAGRRFGDAVSSLRSQEGFIQNQLRRCLETAEQWFPFGFGPGRGYRIDPRDAHEVHNGLLAVLIELGVLGLLGYLGMVLHPLLARRWQERSPDHERLGVLLTTFLVISFVFAFHNTLYRDRIFLLYLGVATTIVREESRSGLPSHLFTPEAGSEGVCNG